MHDRPKNSKMMTNGLIHNHDSMANEANDLAKISQMLDAVRSSHERVLDAVESVSGLSAGQSQREQTKRDQMPALTRREVEVVTLLSEGLSKQKIADQLGLSRSTVCTHARHIFRKLGVSNASGAVGKAFRCGILSL